MFRPFLQAKIDKYNLVIKTRVKQTHCLCQKNQILNVKVTWSYHTDLKAWCYSKTTDGK
jgi:hypothetical protein